MRHTYECPLRWADIDMLGHVNNVTYVDYLQEARIDMFVVHAGFSGVADLAEGVVVVRHEVEFVAPLVFRRRPVLIDVWITDIRAGRFTMAYEVYDEDETGGRHVYLRASSVLAPYVFAGEHPRRLTAREQEVLAQFLEPADPTGSRLPSGTSRNLYLVKVRFSDVDVYRHVNNVKYFEYFQEARIRYVMDLHARGETWSDHAIAHTDVEYRRAMLFRPEPYEVHSWISDLGNRSFAISGEVCDPESAGEVLARCRVVMVAFDRGTQRAADMTPHQRQCLEAEYAAR